MNATVDRRWMRRLVFSAAVAVVAWIIELVGLVTSTKAMWLPAAVVFPAACVAVIICVVVLAKQFFARRST